MAVRDNANQNNLFSSSINDGVKWLKEQVGLETEDSFNKKIQEAMEEGDPAKMVNYMDAVLPKNDQNFTCLLIPNKTTGNTSAIREYRAIQQSVWTKGYEPYIPNPIDRGEGQPKWDRRNFEPTNGKKDSGWALHLSMPIYKNSGYERNIVYPTEPIPIKSNSTQSNMVTDFKSVQPIKFRIQGVVSNIQVLDVTPFQSATRLNLGLPRIQQSTCANLINAGIHNAKSFFMYKYSRVTGTASTIYQNRDAIDNAINDIQNPQNITNSLGLTNENSNVDKNKMGKINIGQNANTYTLCQAYLGLIDSLATSGYLFTLYYLGIPYENVAITRIKIDNDSTNMNSINVIIEAQQIMMSSIGITTESKKAERQPPNKIIGKKNSGASNKKAAQTRQIKTYTRVSNVKL